MIDGRVIVTSHDELVCTLTGKSLWWGVNALVLTKYTCWIKEPSIHDAIDLS